MTNLAAVYGVTVEPAQGSPAWKAISVRRLSGSENQGKHHVFVKVLKANGDRDRNPALKLAWSWDGQRPDQFSPPAPLDKPDHGELGHGNVPINANQSINVGVRGDGIPSDTVRGLRTNFPDEAPGNTWGHFSYEVIFQRTEGQIVTPPIDSGELIWLRAELAAANAKLDAMRAAIRKATAELGSL